MNGTALYISLYICVCVYISQNRIVVRAQLLFSEYFDCFEIFLCHKMIFFPWN